ncbi:MAG: DNA mismatch repair endonuclease MutL, partial [Clostridia bacterium]|nr:DNA mismatch repair endonuclease MutL [Clostridia bacterium]
MGKIHVLEKQVAELIAAGEVVERPASAVKELLENAIDAGADAVTVEIKNGGVTFMRVTDNGSGIAAGDVPAAFLRHATSKILKAEDLDAIVTLGFRGEALASITAVSRCEMLTRTAEELAGTRIELEGGEIVSQGDAGCPEGTTIVVRDLFFNTPARMKFLKKDVSEANAVSAVVERIALSHPEVSLRYLRDGKEELHTPGDGRLISAIHVVFGRQFASDLLAVDYENAGVALRGYVSKPAAARSNRSMQTFFLNGRFVRSKTAAAALEAAFKGQIMVGKYPACVLNIEMNASLADVNVHPAKLEVRFSNERQIFDAVYYGVKNAVGGEDTRPALSLPGAPAIPSNAVTEGMLLDSQMNFGLGRPQKEKGDLLYASSFFNTASAAYEPVQNPQRPQESGQAGAQAPAEREETQPDAAAQAAAAGFVQQTQPGARAVEAGGSYRLVGECFGTYIVAETCDEIWLIDKHA